MTGHGPFVTSSRARPPRGKATSNGDLRNSCPLTPRTDGAVTLFLIVNSLVCSVANLQSTVVSVKVYLNRPVLRLLVQLIVFVCQYSTAIHVEMRALEGVGALSTGNLVSLSEQHFEVCDTIDTGCNSGLIDCASLSPKKCPFYPDTAQDDVCNLWTSRCAPLGESGGDSWTWSPTPSRP